MWEEEGRKELMEGLEAGKMRFYRIWKSDQCKGTLHHKATGHQMHPNMPIRRKRGLGWAQAYPPSARALRVASAKAPEPTPETLNWSKK